MISDLMNKIPGTVKADRPLRTYVDKEKGLIWPKAYIYCFGDVILVQDLDYLSVSIYFIDEPKCEESNYWTETEPMFFTLFHFRPMLVFHATGNTRKHVLGNNGLKCILKH